MTDNLIDGRQGEMADWVVSWTQTFVDRKAKVSGIRDTEVILLGITSDKMGHVSSV